jgi:hypothetical protein
MAAGVTERLLEIGDIVKIIEDWKAPTKNSNVSDAAKYHKLAEECRFLSALCSKQEHKAFWLRVAEDWSKLTQDVNQDQTKVSE